MDASTAIVRELDLRQVFARIAEQAANVLNAEAASVLLLDADKSAFVFECATGPESKRLVGQQFDATLGIAAQAVKARRAIRVDDVSLSSAFFNGIDAVTGRKTRSLIAAPLVHMDREDGEARVLGVVEVLNPNGRNAFSERDVELLQVFANLTAAAAGNAQAYQTRRREHPEEDDDEPAKALPPGQPVQIVGRSPALKRMIELCKKVALSNATVLLYGETGTGKELAARTIHECSERKSGPFIAINCAALPENLLESELFGHEKGAFTGADRTKPGRFELAEGGTLFLDEVGELAPSIQAKLLRALQERSFIRVGGTETLPADVRIVAATNRDLKTEMEAGRFRPDLYYRLNVFPITLSPLRDRVEDIPALVEHFAKDVAAANGHKVAPPFTDSAMAVLLRYPFPGNIRELRNIIERATLMAGDRPVEVMDLPDEIQRATTVPGGSTPVQSAGSPAGASPRPPDAPQDSILEEQERALILHALEQNRWNQSATARHLGITRDLLRYRMKKYALQKPAAAE